MRNSRLLLALLALVLFSSCKGGDILFEGRIIGYNGEYTEFFLANPEGGFTEVPFDINEDGTFSAKLEFARSEYDARLFVDKFMFCTCIEKGKKYYAEFDIRVPEVETDFRFIGEGEKENEFTRDFWNGFGFGYAFLDSVSEVRDFKSYEEGVVSIADDFRERARQTGNKPFRDYYEGVISELQTKYALYYPYLALSRKGAVPNDRDYENFIASSPLEGYSDEEISDLLNEMSGAIVFFPDLDMLEAIKLAEKITSDTRWNHFFMTSLLINRLSGIGPDGMEPAYQYYRTVVTEENLYSQIAGDYEASRILEAGFTAPEIEIADKDGKVLKLSDLKGKALYIDFWATWCKPCCAEIPHLAKLVEELGNDHDIRCVSISIDEDTGAWKKKVENDNPSWSQYIATESGQAAISESYQISSIPRFILLDKEGKIITINAPRPSSLDVKALKAMVAGK